MRRVRIAAIAVGLWTIFGLLWATPSLLGVDASADGRALWEAADHVVVFYWAWALLTPLVRFVARQASERWRSRVRLVGFVLAWAPAAVVAQVVIYAVLLTVLRIEPMAGASALVRTVVRHGGGDLATYLTVIGVSLLLDASRRASEGERAAAELLRFQLQPHFLFNALNTVSTLVLKADTDGALRAIELVSRHLRDVLALQPEAMVTLREELAAVERYVAIEQLRFGAALTIGTDASADALAARLPGSLLQPVVENAIRHGLASDGARGRIMLQATVTARRLLVTVRDPGSGVAGGAAGDVAGDAYPGAGGFGIRYVRERLRQCYGDGASFTLSVTRAGAIARLDLPVTPT